MVFVGPLRRPLHPDRAEFGTNCGDPQRQRQFHGRVDSGDRDHRANPSGGTETRQEYRETLGWLFGVQAGWIAVPDNPSQQQAVLLQRRVDLIPHLAPMAGKADWANYPRNEHAEGVQQCPCGALRGSVLAAAELDRTTHPDV